MFNEIKNFPVQVADAINDTKNLSLDLDKIHRIVIMGMGGSAIAGSIMKDISPHLEIIVERNYFPNAIIDEHTLLIISSYSGNTEETLSYYNHASSFTKNIFGLTSGGELLESLKKDNHNFHILPQGYPPRSILGYTLAVLIKLLDEDELLEFVGWENKLIDKSFFSLIWIDITWPQNVKRMNITNEILKHKTSSNHHIQIPSKLKNDLSGLFYLLNYLDWFSYWCGHLNNVDIDAVESIDILKKELA